MAQQPAPNDPKKSVDILRWVGVLLIPATVVVGIISISAKFDVLSAIITFLVVLTGIPISILQIDKGAFSFISRNKKTGIQVIGGLLLLAILVWNIYTLLSYWGILKPPHPTPPGTATSPTPTLIVTPTYPPTTTPTFEVTDLSRLIPVDRQPTVIDPLTDNSQGYEWDQNATCDFVSGSYQISAPASNQSIGCNMENNKGIFSNFVYQVQMKILEGVNGNNASICTTFRVSGPNLSNDDEVCFSQNGYWSVNGSSGPLSSDASRFPYFITGINQINYITIRASGSTFQVQVNNHDLGGVYTDPGISSGFLGVSLTPDTSASKVAFSNLRVWTL